VLYSLVYDRVCAANDDPVEKKPLFHFQPGTRSFSVSTPLFVTVLVLFVPTETVTPMQLAGIAVLLFGVYLLSRKKKTAITFIGD